MPLDAPVRRPAARRVRSIEPGDADRLAAFHDGLDAESQYRRFFTAHPHLTTAEVDRFTHVDHDGREALVVLEGDRIVAVGRYDRLRDDPSIAEVAFVTAPDRRHLGLATTLLHLLAARATHHGIRTFVAETLGCNVAMRRVLAEAGYPTTSRFVDGITETHLDISGGQPPGDERRS